VLIIPVKQNKLLQEFQSEIRNLSKETNTEEDIKNAIKGYLIYAFQNVFQKKLKLPEGSKFVSYC
jgi:hypothetical protein